MITLMKLMILMNTLLTIFSLNPMKMSFLMLSFSFFTFFILNKMSGESWFSLIFFLLFMGGILIMFLILSSLAPNEKSMKPKISMMLILLILTMPSFGLMNNNTMESNLKWSMSSEFNMELMMLLILGYFFSFIIMISTKKMSMRSF